MDEPNAEAVLRAVMAVTAFGPGGGPPGDVDDDSTTDAAVSTTYDVPGFRGGDAGPCGRVGDGG